MHYCVSQTLGFIFNMGLVSRFSDVYKLLAYYRYNNPARQKYLNILEPDIIRTQETIVLEVSNLDEFICYLDGPGMLWNKCAMTVNRALKGVPSNEAKAFIDCKLLPDSHRYLPKEWAQKERVSSRTVYRWINKVTDEVKRIALASELIPPEEKHIN